MNKFLYLSKEEKNAIAQVVNGADVKSLSLATTLRSVEKKQVEHGDHLIDICSVMGDYKVTESLPYFGCIALGDGLDAIDNLV